MIMEHYRTVAVQGSSSWFKWFGFLTNILKGGKKGKLPKVSHECCRYPMKQLPIYSQAFNAEMRTGEEGRAQREKGGYCIHLQIWIKEYLYINEQNRRRDQRTTPRSLTTLNSTDHSRRMLRYKFIFPQESAELTPLYPSSKGNFCFWGKYQQFPEIPKENRS